MMESYTKTNSFSTPNSRKRPNKIRNEFMQERERIKEEIMRKDQSFKVLAACVRLYGPEGGLMVHHLLYLEGLGKDPFGWIYKIEAEWLEEKGLSRHAQRKGRKRAIGAGVWEEEKRGVPAQNWYRLNFHKLAEDLAPYLDSEGNDSSNESINSEATIVAPQERRVKSPGKRGEFKRPTITKETLVETRVESNGDGSTFGNDLEEHEEAHDTAGKVDTGPRVKEVSEPPTHVKPAWQDEPVSLEPIFAHFDECFDRYDLAPLNRHERRRYGLEIAAIVEDNGADVEDLQAVIVRVIQRSAADKNAYRLSPMQAYQDQVEGKPMPPEPASVGKAYAARWRKEQNERIAAEHAEEEEGYGGY